MSRNEEGEVELIFARPRKESGSLVLTIPKHIVDKLRISTGSRLDLILYNSFVVLKHRERIDYERKPAPEILKLLDRVFELFRELKQLERRYEEETPYPDKLAKLDSRIREIRGILKDTASEILSLLNQKKWFPEAIPFVGKLSVEEVLNVLRAVYDKNYKESEMKNDF